MGILSIIIIGIALSMDAFGVSLGIGLSSNVSRMRKIGYILSFSFFQFFLAFIGGVSGYYFDTYILPIPTVLGGIIIAAVGVLMVFDGLKEKESDLLKKNSMTIVLGISVSIDALVIGFTALHQLGTPLILLVYTILIGLISMFFCTLAFFACRVLRKIKFITKYASLLGGLALIIFGIKMIFF